MFYQKILSLNNGRYINLGKFTITQKLDINRNLVFLFNKKVFQQHYFIFIIIITKLNQLMI